MGEYWLASWAYRPLRTGMQPFVDIDLLSGSALYRKRFLECNKQNTIPSVCMLGAAESQNNCFDLETQDLEALIYGPTFICTENLLLT